MDQGTTNTKVPILYKKGTPDKDQAIAQGCHMLERVYLNLQPDPTLVIAGVEMPLAAPVRDLDGNDMDMVLTGILDLVLMDTTTMTPVVVDFKTAKQAKSQSAADEVIQLSMYAYLMGRAGYADLSHPLECRFQVLRKLKTPKLEIVTTFRTQAHMPRLEKLMQADLPPELHYDAFTGAAGEGFALELIGFLKIYQTLPDPDRILTDPQGAEVPPDPATLFALCGALAKKADPFTFDAIVKYGNRLPEEFCVMLAAFLYLAARRKEIFNLKWSGVDFEIIKVSLQVSSRLSCGISLRPLRIHI